MSPTITTMSRLLQAEQAGLVRLVTDAGAFVSSARAADRTRVERIAEDEREHERAMAGLILERGGSIGPSTVPTDAGGLHFLDLCHLLPLLIADERRLIRSYESAPSTGDEQADALVRRILEDHVRHLAELDRLHPGSGA